MNLMRKVLESMYCGTCDVIEYQKVTDPVTKQTGFQEVIVMLEQPCRLSYNSSPTAGDGNTSSVAQEIKLFLAPEVSIKEGSKIKVTQRGVTKAYTNTGASAIYDNHQEITLKLFERWA